MVETKSRIERAVLNMSIAFLISKRGTCLRAQVGAVITKNHRIVSTGYNGALHDAHHYWDCGVNCDITQKCLHAVHAEANAIVAAAREGIELKGSTVYCTHEPCLECAKLIIQAGIKTVFYCHEYHTHDGLKLLETLGIDYIQIPYESVKNYIKA